MSTFGEDRLVWVAQLPSVGTWSCLPHQAVGSAQLLFSFLESIFSWTLCFTAGEYSES